MMTGISPLKTLNARQAAFVSAYIEGASPHEAALSAGYAEGTARVAGTQLLESPNIALAIARAARIRLARDVPLALSTLRWLTEHSPSHKVRLDAATRLLDRAGIVPPKAPDPPGEFEKPLHELTQEQLYALVAKWTVSAAVAEHELGNRAKAVNPSPDPDIPTESRTTCLRKKTPDKL